jgi:HTH-type transcriptional regulator/antitoxin HipB
MAVRSIYFFGTAFQSFYELQEEGAKRKVDYVLRLVADVERVTMNKKGIRLKSFERHLEERYGRAGSAEREAFDKKAQAFVIGEMLKEARRAAKLSQDELARRARTKKSYISRLENGKIDVQISTLFRIFEEGLGRSVGFVIR